MAASGRGSYDAAVPQTKPRAPQPPSGGYGTEAGAAAAGTAAASSPAAAAAVGVGAAGLAQAGLTFESLEKALDALRRFWTRTRLQNEAWLLSTMKDHAPLGDLHQAAADENARERTFQAKAHVRFKAAMSRALAEPDQAERARRVKVALDAEKRYARQRQEEMARRAVAAVDRAALRRLSPQGAFWKLDPTKKTHTPECVAMAGKLWPWAALDAHYFWPPVHGGCGCSLHGYHAAVKAGWLKAGRVPNADDAVRAVSRIMGLHAEEGELAEVRGKLVELGIMTVGAFDASLVRLVEEELWR